MKVYSPQEPTREERMNPGLDGHRETQWPAGHFPIYHWACLQPSLCKSAFPSLATVQGQASTQHADAKRLVRAYWEQGGKEVNNTSPPAWRYTARHSGRMYHSLSATGLMSPILIFCHLSSTQRKMSHHSEKTEDHPERTRIPYLANVLCAKDQSHLLQTPPKSLQQHAPNTVFHYFISWVCALILLLLKVLRINKGGCLTNLYFL